MEEKANYKLYLAKGKNPPQGSIVGDFKKPGDESFVCEIILNDEEVEKAGCVDAVTGVGGEAVEVDVAIGEQRRADHHIAARDRGRGRGGRRCR